MAKQVLLTTTGTEASFPVPDLGMWFTHPTTDFDLIEEGYRSEVLRYSQSLQDAVDAGYCTLKDEQGKSITNINDYLTPQFAGEKKFGNNGRSSELEIFQVDEPYKITEVSLTAEDTSAQYEIKWYAEVSVSKNNKEVLFCVQIDDTTEIAGGELSCPNKNKFYPLSGFAHETIAAGSHTLSFKMQAPENGVGVKIRRLIISVEKKD